MESFVPHMLAAGLLAFLVALAVGEVLVRLGFTVPDPKARIGCVDGLRGLLAMAVMVGHGLIWVYSVRLGGQWVGVVPGTPPLGAPAVALFFMATGLVFYPRILAGFTQTSWPTVVITRFFRLVPLIALSVALVLIVISIKLQSFPTSADLQPALIWLSSWGEPPLMGFKDSWLVNAGVLWTLKLEWHFYLLMLPGCALGVQIARAIGIPSAIAIGLQFVSALAGVILGRVLDIERLNWFMPFIALFAAGMVAHECQSRPQIATWLRSRVASLAGLVALALGVLLWQSWGNTGIWSILLFLVFFCSVACGNSIFGLLERPGALVLGECSYGIYLLHGILLFVAFDLLLPSLSGLPDIAVIYLIAPLAGLAVLATTVTYWLIERPSIATGKSLAARFRTLVASTKLTVSKVGN